MIEAYLFRHLTGSPALSAGMEAGQLPAERAVAMLAYRGVDAREHRRGLPGSGRTSTGRRRPGGQARG